MDSTNTSNSERSGVFNAELSIVGLASEIGYKSGEYEVQGVEYEGDGEIRVLFQPIALNDS